MSSAERPVQGAPAETAPPIPPAGPPMDGQRHPRGRRWRRGLLLVLTVAAAGGLFLWWWHARADVSTDNAYVVGNITPIASSVNGQVVALFIDDNMIVQPGDPIAQIDPVFFQMEVDQALSDYKQAVYNAKAADITARYTSADRQSLLEGAKAKRDEAEQAVEAAAVAVQTRTRLHEKDEELLASLKAQLPGLEALRRNAQDYYERFKNLARTGDIPVQDRDNREAAYREATAKVESLQNSIKAAERQALASNLELAEAKVRLEQDA
jgi:membrane fusion protein (multidrug efflux system)